jgi:hypothetical protein
MAPEGSLLPLILILSRADPIYTPTTQLEGHLLFVPHYLLNILAAALPTRNNLLYISPSIVKVIDALFFL